MFKNKSITFLIILILVLPSFGKKGKIDISNLMKDRKPPKKQLKTSLLLTRDRMLAINYIKVRNRIYLTKKQRKFKLIFKASIKHILENRKRDYMDLCKDKLSVFELYSQNNSSLFILSPLIYNGKNIQSNIGLMNYGFKNFNEMVLFFRNRYVKDSFNFNIEFGKSLYNDRKSFLNTKLLFDLNKELQTQITFSKGESFSTYEYFLLKNIEFESNDFFETFSLIRNSKNFKIKLTQKYSKIGISFFNSYEFTFEKSGKNLSGYFEGGYLYNLSNLKKDSLYIKMGILKSFGLSKVSFEYPFVLNKNRNPTYFKRLFYGFTPKLKLNAYIEFLDSELFFDFYFTKNNVLYIWGIKKFNL